MLSFYFSLRKIFFLSMIGHSFRNLWKIKHGPEIVCSAPEEDESGSFIFGYQFSRSKHALLTLEFFFYFDKVSFLRVYRLG